MEPRLLLLDEPFASIDEEGRTALQRLLRAVIDRRRVPAVLVTHDAEEALALGDRLVRVERGKTVMAGDPRVLLARRQGVTIAGVRRGPGEVLGAGRVRVHLDEAVIEGPEEQVCGPAGEGEALRLDLP
jgi:molybdate transport system ATP-binding protein